jgi:hypothetical protein
MTYARAKEGNKTDTRRQKQNKAAWPIYVVIKIQIVQSRLPSFGGERLYMYTLILNKLMC